MGDWAWGQHPDEGLGYKAKDSLSVSVCLANPAMVNTAKCVLPLDVCLANPQHLSSLGCSGHDLPLEACLDNPSLLTKPSCAGAVADYTPSLPECMGNKKALCSLNKCGNFDLWKC